MDILEMLSQAKNLDLLFDQTIGHIIFLNVSIDIIEKRIISYDL